MLTLTHTQADRIIDLLLERSGQLDAARELAALQGRNAERNAKERDDHAASLVKVIEAHQKTIDDKERLAAQFEQYKARKARDARRARKAAKP